MPQRFIYLVINYVDETTQKRRTIAIRYLKDNNLLDVFKDYETLRNAKNETARANIIMYCNTYKKAVSLCECWNTTAKKSGLLFEI